MKQDKLMFASLISFMLLFSWNVYSADRVAILVVSDDTFILRGVPKALQEQATEVYEKQGFKVIIVGGTSLEANPINQNTFTQALAQAKNAQDLRIDFIGHGSIVEASTRIKNPLTLTKNRLQSIEKVKTQEPLLAWQVVDANLDLDFKEISLPLGLPKSDESLNHSEIKEALVNYQIKNPNSHVTINLLNCFSGALAQELRSEKNIIVFANSPLSESAVSALQANPKETTSALKNYYDLLANDQDLSSFMKLREEANKKHLTSLSSNLVYHNARLPMTESILGWCEENPSPKLSEKVILTESMKEIFSKVNSELDSIASTYQRTILSQDPDLSLGYISLKVKCDPPKNLSYIQRSKQCYNECLKFNDSINKESQKRNRNIVQIFMQKIEDQLQNPDLKLLETKIRLTLTTTLSDNDYLKLPEFRKGEIGKFAKLEDINLPERIEALKNYTSKAKQACSTGDINSIPCSNYEKGIKQVGKYFSLNASDLKQLWSSRAENKEYDCKSMDFIEISRNLQNQNLDKECLQRFKDMAPESEWKNLLRIYELGERIATRKNQVENRKDQVNCQPQESFFEDMIPLQENFFENMILLLAPVI